MDPDLQTRVPSKATGQEIRVEQLPPCVRENASLLDITRGTALDPSNAGGRLSRLDCIKEGGMREIQTPVRGQAPAVPPGPMPGRQEEHRIRAIPRQAAAHAPQRLLVPAVAQGGAQTTLPPCSHTSCQHRILQTPRRRRRERVCDKNEISRRDSFQTFLSKTISAAAVAAAAVTVAAFVMDVTCTSSPSNTTLQSALMSVRIMAIQCIKQHCNVSRQEWTRDEPWPRLQPTSWLAFQH